MEKMIVVGNENFDELIKENGYYVDKTELLNESFSIWDISDYYIINLHSVQYTCK